MVPIPIAPTVATAASETSFFPSILDIDCGARSGLQLFLYLLLDGRKLGGDTSWAGMEAGGMSK